MRAITQEISCSVEGFESLRIAVNVGMAQAEFDRRRGRGEVAPAIVGFPNWDDAAAEIGLLAVNPETGEPTGDPMAAPPVPLTLEGLAELPFVLVNYLAGDQVVTDALKAYREDHYPNSSRR